MPALRLARAQRAAAAATTSTIEASWHRPLRSSIADAVSLLPAETVGLVLCAGVGAEASGWIPAWAVRAKRCCCRARVLIDAQHLAPALDPRVFLALAERPPPRTPTPSQLSLAVGGRESHPLGSCARAPRGASTTPSAATHSPVSRRLRPRVAYRAALRGEHGCRSTLRGRSCAVTAAAAGKTEAAP